MATPQELLNKIDEEILAAVDALVKEKDAEIKAAAQEAYDAAVQAKIAEIKAEVEAKYDTARKYLLELIPQGDAPPVEEGVEEPAQEAEAQHTVEEVKPAENTGVEVL